MFVSLKEKFGFKVLYKVRIVYKSGHVHEGWFTKFDIKHKQDGSLSNVSYEMDCYPKAILIGNLESIESIWQLGSK